MIILTGYQMRFAHWQHHNSDDCETLFACLQVLAQLEAEGN